MVAANRGLSQLTMAGLERKIIEIPDDGTRLRIRRRNI